MELRNYAAKNGNMHPVHRKVVDFLKTTGHAVPIIDKVKAQRKELGLDEIPPTLYKFKDEPRQDLHKYAACLFDLAPVDEEKAKRLTAHK